MPPRAASKRVSGFRFGVSRLSYFLLLTSYSLLLTSCSSPASTQPSFKIGLVAPFEGHSRQVGYDVIYAARLAIRQANLAEGVGGYRVELIALDDGGEPEAAAQQASMLALDPAVMGVIGHFGLETSDAAAPIYAREGLPVLILADLPAAELESAVCLDPAAARLAGEFAAYAEQFNADYATVSGGVPPGPYAWVAYRAVRMLLEAARLDIEANSAPFLNGGLSRAGVDKQLCSQR
ncbi:MAG: ABC transporter substrate-binding protein [Thermoflexales bacterium]|nr:ABC transporter substrate-binding protein [Thermoflexales bacterium]